MLRGRGGPSLTVLAGSERDDLSPEGAFADGAAKSARFSFPSGVPIDAGGAVYVVDSGNNRIRRISGGRTVSTIAGAGRAPHQHALAARSID